MPHSIVLRYPIKITFFLSGRLRGGDPFNPRHWRYNPGPYGSIDATIHFRCYHPLMCGPGCMSCNDPDLQLIDWG